MSLIFEILPGLEQIAFEPRGFHVLEIKGLESARRFHAGEILIDSPAKETKN